MTILMCNDCQEVSYYGAFIDGEWFCASCAQDHVDDDWGADWEDMGEM